MSMFWNTLAQYATDWYFTIDLNITSSNLSFGVTPYWNTGGWCKIVDWGDGTTQAATTSGTQLTHTYASVGSYRVKVQGDMYRFLVGGTNPEAVIGCNGNWEALGNITNMASMFANLSKLQMTVSKLPNFLSALTYTFSGCRLAVVDTDSIAASNAGNWDSVTSIRAFCFNVNLATGRVATFMRKLPNVNNVTNSFQNTNMTTFGDNDYFEITLTTTSANQVWGFTPASSTGTWYCFDWGDGTAVTSNKNLDVFTSGTKVTHTFAIPGTYHIKLATAPCTIVFDQYDSDNGNWAALGIPTEGITGVWVKEGSSTVSSGITMSGATIASGQSQNVYDLGVASACVISGGTQYISSGGAASACIGSAGQTHVYAGGLIDGFTGITGACYISSGASAQNLDFRAGYGGAVFSTGRVSGIVLSGTNARITLYAGAAVDDIHVSAGASANVYGGHMSGVQMYGVGAQIFVYNGGLLVDGVAEYGATYQVSSGGSATGVTVYHGGNVNVWNGGTATSVTAVYSLGGVGAIRTLNGGFVNSAIISSGGYCHVSSGGLVSAVTVVAGGSLTVSSGGSALAVTSNAGASIIVSDGGYIEYTNVGPVDGETGVWLKNRYTSAVISSGMSMDTLDVASGQALNVYNSGYVNSVLMPSAGAAVPVIYEGGTINYLRLSGGYLSATFESGGTVNSLYIESCSNPTVSGPGSIGELTLDHISSGVLYLRGDVHISEFIQLRGAAHIYNANVTTANAAGTIFADDSCSIGTVTVSSGGSLVVASGASVSLADPKEGAKLTSMTGGYVEIHGAVWFDNDYNVVSSAQQLSSVGLGSKHILWVCASGSVGTATVGSSATVSVYSGGSVSSATITGNTSSGTFIIDSGGRIESMYISGARNAAIVGNGTIGELITYSTNQLPVTGTVIEYLKQNTMGGVHLRSGGVISSGDVYGNHLHISNGIISAVTVYNGGHMSVYAGGTALGVLVSSGGDVVNAGGYIEYVTP